VAKFRSIKNSFITGKVSRTALGRTDLPQYNHACVQLKNMIPLLAGGLYRRPGSLFQKSYDATTAAPFLIPFVAADDTRFMLNLRAAPSPYSGTPVTTAFQWVPGVGADTINDKFTEGASANIVQGNLIPWTDEEMSEVRYAQSGDILWLVHPNHKPKMLRRTGTNTFKLVNFDEENLDGSALTGPQFMAAWPYQKQNPLATTLTPSATTGSITVNASAPTFFPAHVGSVWKLDHSSTVGCFVVTAYTSATQVTGTVMQILGGTGATAAWWESAWSDLRGWPGTVSFFEQRLCYGGTAGFPDSIWFSGFAAFTTLSKYNVINPQSDAAMVNTDPFTATLAAPIVSRITWLRPTSNTMLVGTRKNETAMNRADTTTGFGPTNYAADHQSDYGSNGIIETVGNEVFIVSDDGLTLRSLAFSFTDQTYAAEEVQTLYPEFPYLDRSGPLATSKRAFKQLAWDESRSVLWCLDESGQLRGFSRSRKLGVATWHEHELGGYDASVVPGNKYGGVGFGGSGSKSAYLCAGSILSIAVLPHPINHKSELWLDRTPQARC
jgi:hypothetical protein